MPETRTLTLVPRAGRGLVTAYNPQSTPEVVDSFIEFTNLFIRDSSWQVREQDIVGVAPGGAFPPIRSQHAFNQIIDADGSIDFSALVVANDKLYDNAFGLLATLNPPFKLYYETVKNRVFFGGSNNAPKIFDGASVYQWGAEGSETDMTYIAIDANNAPDAKISYSTSHLTNGTKNVTWVSGEKYTTGTAWQQKPMVIDGIQYRIDTVTSDVALVLTAVYTGTTANHNAYVHYGDLSWTIPPQYCYCYYNPDTGHITNKSPTLRISEKNVDSVAVALRTIATNPTLFAAGYTKIVLFRTRMDGTDMADLYLDTADGMLDNQNVLTDLDYNDSQPDTMIGQLLGDFPAPETNDPPPMFRFMAYWGGRFWLIEQDRQWRLRYSSDADTTLLGVPEECFPEGFFLDVNSSDGYATGLKVVGTTLMITTERWTYYIFGDEPSTYRIRRLSTRGFGVSQHAIDEHPGDSTTDSASAIYVSRDKRVWRHFEGGTIKDIGAPLQDKWDQADMKHTDPFMVKVFRLDKLWIAAVGFAIRPLGAYATYFYDFDAEAWYDWEYSTENSSITHFVGYPYLHTASSASFKGTNLVSFGWRDAAQITYLWLGTPGASRYDGIFKTHHLDHGDRLGKKELEAVWLHVNDAAQPGYQVSCFYNESDVEVPLTPIDVSNSPRNPGGDLLCFVPQEPRQWHTCSYRVRIPGGIIGTPRNRVFRFDSKFRSITTGAAGNP